MRVIRGAISAMMMGVAAFALTASTAPGGGGGDSQTVNYYDQSGRLAVALSAPSNSRFSTHGSRGGKRPPCKFPKQVERDPDSTVPPKPEWVDGKWQFTQSNPPWDYFIDPDGRWPLEGDDFLRFEVQCVYEGETYHIEFIQVSIHDPFFWDEATFLQLRAEMKLNPITVRQPDSVGRWGGIIVRNPMALQVDGGAWKAQASKTRYRHGVALAVGARPRTLVFDVTWSPNENARDGASAQSWTTTCATGYAKSGAAWFPNVKLPAESQLVGLVDGQCGWVAPDSGQAVVKATITFDVVNVVNGIARPAPDYVWSTEVTLATGQLRAVNVKD